MRKRRQLKIAVPQDPTTPMVACDHKPVLRTLAYGAVGVTAIAAAVYYGSMQGARKGFDGQHVTVDVVDAKKALEFHKQSKSA